MTTSSSQGWQSKEHSDGFDFEGARVPLIGPQGIFKPAVLPEIPLSIATAPVVEGLRRRMAETERLVLERREKARGLLPVIVAHLTRSYGASEDHPLGIARDR